MRTGGLFQFYVIRMEFATNYAIIRFGRNYAKNYASIICQGLVLVPLQYYQEYIMVTYKDFLLKSCTLGITKQYFPFFFWPNSEVY